MDSSVLHSYGISSSASCFIIPVNTVCRSRGIPVPTARIRGILFGASQLTRFRRLLVRTHRWPQLEESVSCSSNPNIGLGLASGLIGIFFSLNFIVETTGNAALLSSYACEDVSHYYAPTEQIKGMALMKKLNSIISHHQSLPYKEVWDALKILDAADMNYPETSPDIVEIYTLRAVSKLLAGKPDGWNREHLWPRSYGLVDGPSLTDLHNIRPADANVNSSRGNKYYGECAMYSNDCLRPASREAAPDTETDKHRWAPPSQVRGDIARSVMYMAVRYGFYESSGSPMLQLTDSPSIERREMGLLSTLLQWNELDPPSIVEKLRNDRICKLYQHNRNPFVDHPEFSNLIWKDMIQSYPITYSSSMKAWINEFHYNNKGKDKNEFVEIVVPSSANAAALELVLYNGTSGKMYKSLSLADERAFKVTAVDSGFLIYAAFVPLQNGPADGIALISCPDGNDCQVIQFLSYEGVLKAMDGPVKGSESVDIKVRETEESSTLGSVGLSGRLGEFKWKRFADSASPGKPNVGQNLLDP